jgi:hypothetical protein
MDDQIIKKTFNTPEISFKPDEGYLKIEGRAIPEDPGEFFEAVIIWLKDYYKAPRDLTKVDIKLEYINSGSSKYMLELLRILKVNYDQGKDCIVNWFYEEDDESIYELGQHYQATVQLPFKIIDYY